MMWSPNEDETAAHGYGPTFIGFSRASVLQNQLLLRSISPAVMLLRRGSGWGAWFSVIS